MRLPTLQLVKLNPECIEDATDTRMICKHHATNYVLSGYIRAFLGEGHLNRGGSPRNEVSKFALTNSLE